MGRGFKWLDTFVAEAFVDIVDLFNGSSLWRDDVPFAFDVNESFYFFFFFDCRCDWCAVQRNY